MERGLDLHALAEEAGDDWFQHSYQDKDYRSTVVQCVERALTKLQEAYKWARLSDLAELETANARIRKLEAERTAAVAEALERAAQVAEKYAEGLPNVTMEQCAMRGAVRYAADAIRSLKPRSDMVCLPREPTRGMLSALMGDPPILAASDEQIGREAWKRMLAAVVCGDLDTEDEHYWKLLVAAAKGKP